MCCFAQRCKGAKAQSEKELAMDLSFKDIKFMIEAVDNLMVKYQERINQIEDSDEYEDEVSDLGNDMMFLSSLRKKIDDSLNDSLNPKVDANALTKYVSKRRKDIWKITKIPTPKTPKSIKQSSTNLPSVHIKSEFDEDK
jgi:hypothetical protein